MNCDKLIVFDMDGVIVDVSGSYREAVRQTARLFFKGVASENRLPEPLFSLPDLASVKQAGGLNNDWELTYSVIALLLTKVKTPAIPPYLKGWAGLDYLRPRCDAAALSHYLGSSSTPLADLAAQHAQEANPWIAHLSSNDVGTGNVIKQIFQELYLGGRLFRQTYGMDPRVHDGNGLIDRESLLIPASVFERLAKTHGLALATGRPRSEAEHALSRFKLQHFFQTVYTLDECLAEEKSIYARSNQVVSLGKPHPFMLDAIVESCRDKPGDLYYVGDMPDDMQAASNSSYAYKGVGLLHASPHKKTLEQGLIQAGASVVVEDAAALLGYFNGCRVR